MRFVLEVTEKPLTVLLQDHQFLNHFILHRAFIPKVLLGKLHIFCNASNEFYLFLP